MVIMINDHVFEPQGGYIVLHFGNALYVNFPCLACLRACGRKALRQQSR